MAYIPSLTELITDGHGHAKTDFLTCSASEWADKQMMLRYSTYLLESDAPGSFPHACWQHLQEEHEALRSWFNDAGELQPMLRSASVANRLYGPIGDGIGFDFDSAGRPENQMLFFKGVLISVYRAAQLIPRAERNNGNAQIGNLPKLVYSAYDARARIHRWRGTEGADDEIDVCQALAARCETSRDAIAAALRAAGLTPPERPQRRRMVDGAELSRRWVTMQTFTYLIRLGVSDAKWAWDASRARSLFGPYEEERALL